MKLKKSTLSELNTTLLNKIVAFRQRGKLWSTWCLVTGVTVRLDVTGELELVWLNLTSLDPKMRRSIYIGDTDIENVLSYEEILALHKDYSPTMSALSLMENTPIAADAMVDEFDCLISLLDTYVPDGALYAASE